MVVVIPGELQCVKGGADLQPAIQPVQPGKPPFQVRLDVGLEPALAGVLRQQHTHIHPSLKELAGVIVVGHQDEGQPFQKGEQLGRNVTKIDGRTQKQHIGRQNVVQQRREIIFPVVAAELRTFALAGQAAPASGEGKIVQLDKFRFRSVFFGPIQSRTEHLLRVPALSGTTFDRDYLHSLTRLSSQHLFYRDGLDLTEDVLG